LPGLAFKGGKPPEATLALSLAPHSKTERASVNGIDALKKAS
jgi:hypothetical protein